MDMGRERERSEVMRAGIGAGMAEEREDLSDDGREVKESLVQCGSTWDWRIRNVSRPGIGAEVVVVRRSRRRKKKEIAVEDILKAVTDGSESEGSEKS